MKSKLLYVLLAVVILLAVISFPAVPVAFSNSSIVQCIPSGIRAGGVIFLPLRFVECHKQFIEKANNEAMNVKYRYGVIPPFIISEDVKTTSLGQLCSTTSSCVDIGKNLEITRPEVLERCINRKTMLPEFCEEKSDGTPLTLKFHGPVPQQMIIEKKAEDCSSETGEMYLVYPHNSTNITTYLGNGNYTIASWNMSGYLIGTVNLRMETGIKATVEYYTESIIIKKEKYR